MILWYFLYRNLTICRIDEKKHWTAEEMKYTWTIRGHSLSHPVHHQGYDGDMEDTRLWIRSINVDFIYIMIFLYDKFDTNDGAPRCDVEISMLCIIYTSCGTYWQVDTATVKMLKFVPFLKQFNHIYTLNSYWNTLICICHNANTHTGSLNLIFNFCYRNHRYRTETPANL